MGYTGASDSKPLVGKVMARILMSRRVRFKNKVAPKTGERSIQQFPEVKS